MKSPTSRGWVIALTLVLAGAATACGGDGTSTAPREATMVTVGEQFAAGVPTPAQAPILTFTGAAGPANDDGAISFDLATLERLGLHEWTVFEPFLDGDHTFRGVPFDVVLDAVGVPSDATEATLTALDEYAVTLPLEDLLSGDVLLVTQDDQPGTIGVDRGGPIRFIWRDGSENSQNPDLWIWSIRTVTVR